MSSVGSFVKIIVVLTFLWCIVEMILPENSMKKYSSFVYGLVIISLGVSIFTNVDYNNFYVFENSTNISDNNKSYLRNLYEENLEKALIKKTGDDSINIELTEEYKIKKINCDSQETYDDIMRYLNE